MTDRTFFISRTELERVFNPRAARQFEELQERVATSAETTSANVDATEAMQQAAFVTLSPNTELPNEFVLSVGPGLSLTTGPGTVTLFSGAPQITGGHGVTFSVEGETLLVLPINGVVVTHSSTVTLSNKTLAAPKLSGLGNYADDTAAAAGGVPVNGMYHNAGALRVRLT